MFKFLVRLVLAMYLRFCLFVGCHRYVYRITARWGKSYSKMPLRCFAAEDMQQRLVKKGYCLCSVCCFATEHPNQHLEDLDSSCYWIHVASLPQCPKCYAPLEEGTECANCKINRQIEGQRLSMLVIEHEREMEWEAMVKNEAYRAGYPEDELEEC